MTTENTMTNIKTSEQFAKEFIDVQEKKAKDPESYYGYKIPLPWLMSRTGGFGRDWYTIVTGKAKSGKTSVLATAAANFGVQGIPFVWLGLEESTITVATRVFANMAKISRIKFRDITLEERDWPALYQAANSISAFKAWWSYGVSTPKDIIEILKKLKPQVLFVDYIQLMSMSGFRSKTEEISACSKFLLAASNGTYTDGQPVSVIAAAQENDDGTPLWCKDLLRDCDLALGIEELPDGTGGALAGRRKLSIDIFRHGEKDSAHIGFIGERSLVCEFISTPVRPPPGMKP
jgi:replicative DNA helicase